jgi:hypothetical protein
MYGAKGVLLLLGLTMRNCLPYVLCSEIQVLKCNRKRSTNAATAHKNEELQRPVGLELTFSAG